MYFFIFFTISYPEVIKTLITVIIYENYNQCKTKHLFLIKKLVTRFDKKNNDMSEKGHRRREESITAYNTEEDPISEDSKRTLSLRTLKRILSMRNVKTMEINGDPQEL